MSDNILLQQPQHQENSFSSYVFSSSVDNSTTNNYLSCNSFQNENNDDNKIFEERNQPILSNEQINHLTNMIHAKEETSYNIRIPTTPNNNSSNSFTNISNSFYNNQIFPHHMPSIPSSPSNSINNNSTNHSIKNSQVIPHNGVEPTHIDITCYLHLPQTEAAKKLGIPTSTLSKRWKEAVVNNRKWPYRAVSKLDKEIMTLLHNIPQGPGAPSLPQDIEKSLGILLKKRQEELKPVIIRV